MKDVMIVPIDKEVIQTTCMWCVESEADYFVVKLVRGRTRYPLAICEKCAKKEGFKRGDEVSGADADAGK